MASPNVKCVAVALNGDVTLTWDIPADPAGVFANYSIYVSTVSSLGPFTLVGTVTTHKILLPTLVPMQMHKECIIKYIRIIIPAL